MKLTFTKGAGKYDQLTIQRDGQQGELIQCPKQRIIPHDMVHYAVESTLHARGFLGRVIAGESASFQMQPEAESDSVERLVEVFQGDAWSGSTTPAEDMIDMYRVTCQARGCPMLAISVADVHSIRERISELDVLWMEVPVGQSLELLLGESSPAAVRDAA